MAGFEHVSLDDLEPIDLGSGDVALWHPLRHRLGIRAFGMNAWTARGAGEVAIERHDEVPPSGDAGAGHQEVYVVLRGAADFRVGDERFAVRAGSIVVVHDPALVREAIATEPDTTILTVGATPGRAFRPSAWEARWLNEAGAA